MLCKLHIEDEVKRFLTHFLKYVIKLVDVDITKYNQLWQEIQKRRQNLARALKNAKLNVMIVRDAPLLNITTRGRRNTNVKPTRMVMQMLYQLKHRDIIGPPVLVISKVLSSFSIC